MAAPSSNQPFGASNTTTQQLGGAFGTNSFGSLQSNFGSSQPSAFATSQPSSFGGAQASSFGAPQNPVFGSTPASSAFGTTQANNFGTNQSSGFGSSQTPAFGTSQSSSFGSAQPSMGNTQASAFGGTQPTTFGSSQPSLFGSSQPAAFGSAQPTAFGANPTSVFGGAQPSAFGSTSSQPASSSFAGSTQQPSTFGSQPSAFINTPSTSAFGTMAAPQSSATSAPFGASASFGTTAPSFGGLGNLSGAASSPFTSTKNLPASSQPFGSSGTARLQPPLFGSGSGTAAVGTGSTSSTFGAQNSVFGQTPSFNPPQSATPATAQFGASQTTTPATSLVSTSQPSNLNSSFGSSNVSAGLTTAFSSNPLGTQSSTAQPTNPLTSGLTISAAGTSGSANTGNNAPTGFFGKPIIPTSSASTTQPTIPSFNFDATKSNTTTEPEKSTASAKVIGSFDTSNLAKTAEPFKSSVATETTDEKTKKPEAGIFADLQKPVPGALDASVLPTSVTFPSNLKNKTLEEIISCWGDDLETLVNAFERQSVHVAHWDKRIVNNGEQIIALDSRVLQLEALQQEVESSLSYVNAQQAELEILLDNIERELPVPTATNQVLASSYGSVSEASRERGRLYETAGQGQDRLLQIAESLSSLIGRINMASSSAEEGGNQNGAPLINAVQTLNCHLDALQWIDRKVDELVKVSAKVKSQTSRALVDAERISADSK